jgi:hypothetical protein
VQSGVPIGIDGVMHFVFKNLRTGLDRWPFYKCQVLILNMAFGGDVGCAIDDTVFLILVKVEHVRVCRTRTS